MNIEVGNFCFVEETYYDRFNDSKLMINKVKDGGGYRPHYLAFRDNRNPEIFWAVPISSSLENYTNKRNNRMAHNSQHRCDEIIIARARYGNAAYLIQNMCPVDARYIKGIWEQNGKPIGISKQSGKTITQSARRVLEAERRGGHRIQPRALSIYKALNLDIQVKQALPILKENRKLVLCQFEKSTERGTRITHLNIESQTPPQDISLVETDRLFDGSEHTKKTPITDGRFVDALQGVLTTKWDSVTEKISEFEASLDAAEQKSKSLQNEKGVQRKEVEHDNLR